MAINIKRRTRLRTPWTLVCYYRIAYRIARGYTGRIESAAIATAMMLAALKVATK